VAQQGPDPGREVHRTDPDVAKKYDMHDESEFFDDEDEGIEPEGEGRR
jgi:hypothetical protein